MVLPVLCLAALVAAGCDASSSGGSTTPSATASASGSGSPSASPSPTVTGFTKTCDNALSLTAVSQAAGQPIIGRTSFVVGEPDTTIGRLAYLNCRYGLPETPTTGATTTTEPTPGVEIGVSLYDSVDRARTRVDGTVEDYRSSGSRAETVRVGTVNGTVLVGGGSPTLVVASGARTVAVSIGPKVSTGFAQLVAVAELALAQVS